MFELAYPWLLLLLPLPWIIRRLIKPAAEIKSAALRIPFFQALQQVPGSNIGHEHFNSWRKWAIFLGWLLLLIAAAGPQWLGKPITLPQSGRNLMLAIDISGSMQIPDMKVDNQPTDRLSMVKSVANSFINKRKGDRLGLILFGSRAYLQTPLTFDRKTVEGMLDDATIGLAGQQTAVGDAIGIAIKRLMKEAKQHRILILLTDGANNSGTVTPLAAAEMAKKAGIKIYTIGIGSDKLAVSGLFGPQILNPSADLDENTLEKIANITGGQYFRAKNTASLAGIYQELNKLEPIISNDNIFRPIKPLYPWPLGFALLITLLLCWRHTPLSKPFIESSFNEK